jgi:hypothetical protein
VCAQADCVCAPADTQVGPYAQRCHNLAHDFQRVIVVLGKMIGYAGFVCVHERPAQILSGHFLARGGFYQRRPAEEDRPRAFDDHRFVAHGRNVCPACRATAHHRRNLRDAQRAHASLIVENASEVIAVGEYFRLQGQKCAPRVHEVDAGQTVFFGHLLRAQMFFDGEGIVGSPFDGGVIGNNEALATGHAPHAGDDACAGGVPAVEAPRGQRVEFQKRRAGVEQFVHSLPHKQLALLLVAAPPRPSPPHLRQPRPQFLRQRAVVGGVFAKAFVGGVKLRFDGGHGRSLQRQWQNFSEQCGKS